MSTNPRFNATLLNSVALYRKLDILEVIIMAQKAPDMVVKSNSLIEASYSLTLNEMRLLDIALAELSSYEECEKHVTTLPEMIHIRAEEYAELYGVTNDMAYLALKEASEQLFTRYFTYYVKTEHFPSHKEVRKARWVQEIGYVEGQGVVMMSFSKRLVELAGKLKSNFSRYHLEQKAPLTSMYAHRLYEMMMQWRGSKTVPYITYFELRDRFGIEKEEYDRVTNFKARVLDQAIKQINEHTDITATYEQVKKGRSVAGFTFKFKPKQSKKPVIKDANKNVTNAKSDTTKRPPKAIPTMSAPQRNTFANKLLNNFDFIRDHNGQTIGKSRDELLLWVEQGLADDNKRQEWRKYLLMVGYEFPDKLKK